MSGRNLYADRLKISLQINNSRSSRNIYNTPGKLCPVMNPVCPGFSRRTRVPIVTVLLVFVSCLLVTGVLAADEYYTGYFGDVITLQGFSYKGDRVYLFMTGPNLPADGVTLTDVTQRADQGHFTIIDLDDSRHWSFNWDTSRLQNQIVPGTYMVYVTNEPLDLSQLGGPDTYKTLSAYLKNPETPQGSVGGGTSYTLNPEEHASTVIEMPLTVSVTTTVVSASPVPTLTTALTHTTLSQTAAPTRAANQTIAAVIALVICAGLILFRPSRR
jgi:hypothetical protein